ncbi:MAG TPA: sulfatase [Anaerolineales bacterium]
MMRMISSLFDLHETIKMHRERTAWWRLGLLTAFVVYFYVFMEWLFFVTKPSFMDVMAIGQKIEILLFTALFLTLVCLAGIVFLFGLSLLPKRSTIWLALLYAGGLIPAGILAATSLLLVDNFTYTLFQVGVVTSQGFFRGLYGGIFLAALVLWYRWVLRHLKSGLDTPRAGRPLLTQSVLGVGVIVIASALALPKINLLSNFNSEGAIGGVTKRPNILLLGSDGVNTSNMSVYGYERDTTPNLHALAKSSLLAENAFPNSANTSGSIISMLTGKHATNTGVIYPPDILRNSDSYQHLPGILRSLGYRNIEISIAHYIDAYTLNLRDGFDIVNERSLDQAGFHAFTQIGAFEDSGYFLSILAERVSDRILHIFFLREMTNPYQEVTTNQFNTSDQKRVRKLVDYVKQSDQPVFIHVHLMDTHGAKFTLDKQVFSSGQTQDSGWMTDFYDDAILQFDDYVGNVWSELTKMGELENTIIIIYSDHAQQYQTDQSVPLIIRFPEGEFSGRIRNNVQNIDIAPTILDYMGLPIPKWMEGQSLLAGEPDPVRPIFSTGVTYGTVDDNGYWTIDLEGIEPPFYQFGYLRAIVCQKWYRINLRDFIWEEGEVVGHSAPCEGEISPDAKSVQKEILKRLEMDGFDISSLQTFFSALDSK